MSLRNEFGTGHAHVERVSARGSGSMLVTRRSQETEFSASPSESILHYGRSYVKF
jgi:hypothetical protein